MFFAYTPDGRRWAYADGVWSWIDSKGGQVPCVSSEALQPKLPPEANELATMMRDAARYRAIRSASDMEQNENGKWMFTLPELDVLDPPVGAPFTPLEWRSFGRAGLRRSTTRGAPLTTALRPSSRTGTAA